MALVIAKKSKTAPYVKGKSEKETLMELFLGKSGVKFREAAAKAIGLAPKDGIWFAEEKDKKGKVKSLAIYKTTEADEESYVVGENLVVTGKDIKQALLDLAGLESIEGKIANFTIDVENPTVAEGYDEETKTTRTVNVYQVKFKDIEDARKRKSSDKTDDETSKVEDQTEVI